MSKYHAKRTNGYASKKEANCAAELHILESEGEVRNVREQVPFDLLPADKSSGYSRPLRYIADFVYDQATEAGDWEGVVADAKGFRTPVYKIKKRLMKQLLGIEVREV